MELTRLDGVDTPTRRSPTFYRTDRGTFVIQGWKLDEESKGKAQDFRPSAEDLVEIPEELVHLIVNHVRSGV